MPISITPVIPPQASAPVSLEQLLQPGAVVEARVVAQLNASLVRILIASIAVDVATEVPLQPGTTLRLEVSRNGEGGGLRLTAAPSATAAAPPGAAASPSAAIAAPSDAILRHAPTDPVTAAVAQAVRHAAPRQGGLSPLFANLVAALEQGRLPPQVRAAIAPLVAMRPELSAGITAPQLQKALQHSGLLLESSVAAGRAPQVQTPMQVPDLKAALIVLRQVLSQWQGASSTVATPSLPLPSPAAPVVNPNVAVTSVTPVTPAVAVSSVTPAQNVAVIDDFIAALTTPQPPIRTDAIPSPRAISAGVMLTMLQDVADNMDDALKSVGSTRGAPSQDMPVTRALLQPQPDTPPPPYRGAPPSAQAVTLPSISADDPLPVVVRRLTEDVDGALARQTLLQIASLPEQPAQQAQRSEQPRWAFEIPFATPQGTAVAQFEISRDGHATQEVEPTQRIWRARFSLNVEPAGPVHASIALTGERASVRLWADRPETIARLRDSTPLLSHALREADLDPGEITVGRPPQAAPVAAGQFWNRAS